MSVDDILYAPVSQPEHPTASFNSYKKGDLVPEFLLKFYDARVVVVFGVDAEVVADASNVVWVYPFRYLNADECVVQITYPEKRLFSNLNKCIISVDPHPDKRNPNHISAPNVEAVKEIWP